MRKDADIVDEKKKTRERLLSAGATLAHMVSKDRAVSDSIEALHREAFFQGYSAGVDEAQKNDTLWIPKSLIFFGVICFVIGFLADQTVQTVAEAMKYLD